MGHCDLEDISLLWAEKCDLLVLKGSLWLFHLKGTDWGTDGSTEIS